MPRDREHPVVHAFGAAALAARGDHLGLLALWDLVGEEGPAFRNTVLQELASLPALVAEKYGETDPVALLDRCLLEAARLHPPHAVPGDHR